jgi:hypothetical protein
MEKPKLSSKSLKQGIKQEKSSNISVNKNYSKSLVVPSENKHVVSP